MSAGPPRFRQMVARSRGSPSLAGHGGCTTVVAIVVAEARMSDSWLERTARPVLAHSARTAIASVVSLLAARACQLPEAYWAPITTFVITQSSLCAALEVSSQRWIGTALGALVGALVAHYFQSSAFLFGTCVFILGPLVAAARCDRSAYRFGGITLAIVLMVPRAAPAWHVALHRFAEVSIGIGVALALARLWPEQEPPGERTP